MKSSKSRNNSSQRTSIAKDDEIDEIIKDITLKRPKNSYTQFVLSEIEKFKKKNKDAKIVLADMVKQTSKKWKEISDSEKQKFDKLYEADKEKYRKDLETVKHYLFRDYNETKKSAPTAYRIFLNEKMREGFEKGDDPKDVKKDARETWSRMSEDEKKIYFDRKKESDDWFEKAKNVRRVTPLSIYIQRTIQAAKDNHKDPPSLKEIAPGWKSLSKSEKRKYENYAEEINEEKKQMKDIYELTHGIKPSRPLGAYKIFLQEKAKNNELKSLQDGRDQWEKLSQSEKDDYLTKAHKYKIAYIYKKMIYKKKIKKLMPKRPGTAFSFFLKEKKGQKPAKGEKFIVYFRGVYEDLAKAQKKKYEDKAEAAKEAYAKKMKDFEDKVFDFPKKALSGFSLYIRDRMPDLREEKKGKAVSELLKIIAKEWKEENGVDRDQYNKKSEREQKRFKRQLKEFQKNGYYTKSKGGKSSKKNKDEDEDDEEDDSDEEKEKESRKTRKRKKSASKSKSAKKDKKDKKGRSSNRKSKTQDVRSKSGKRKKSKK